MSLLSANNPFGILNKPVLPLFLRCAIGVVLLDFIEYWVHHSFHGFHWLWRIHQVHHCIDGQARNSRKRQS